MVIMAVLGVSLVRIMISDSRVVSHQDAIMSARQGARAAMNTMTAELRSITDKGLIADSAKKIVANVPYAFGVLCSSSFVGATAALLPTDSVSYNSAQPAGLAYLNYPPTGAYFYPSSWWFFVTSSTNTGACISGNDTVKILTGTPPGKLVDIWAPGLSPSPAAFPPGHLFFLYQKVTYYFGNSQDPTLAGRIALFRQVGTLPAEELIAPFDTSAGFRCLTGPYLSRTTCPQPVGNVRGLELRLVGASVDPPQGMSAPSTFNLTTRIVFANDTIH